jgi:hypothetical protein
LSPDQAFAALHHTGRKKPKALLPWAESTNGGGGGDKRPGESESALFTPRDHRMRTSVERFLLRCNKLPAGI